MLNVIMMSAIIMTVVMLKPHSIMPNIILTSAVAPILKALLYDRNKKVSPFTINHIKLSIGGRKSLAVQKIADILSLRK
jgi:hypothetical protein